jgi:hypothetical protein
MEGRAIPAGTTQGGRARFWRVGAALLLTLLLGRRDLMSLRS